jgi:competence protein ComEC
MHGAALRADVLIAPHHGSRTSSTPALIATVAPDYVLFPAAYRNRFGFPHAEVLERYAKRNVHAFITGETGAISFDVAMELRGPTLQRRANARFWHVKHFNWARHGTQKIAARDRSAP